MTNVMNGNSGRLSMESAIMMSLTAATLSERVAPSELWGTMDNFVAKRSAEQKEEKLFYITYEVKLPAVYYFQTEEKTLATIRFAKKSTTGGSLHPDRESSYNVIDTGREIEGVKSVSKTSFMAQISPEVFSYYLESAKKRSKLFAFFLNPLKC